MVRQGILVPIGGFLLGILLTWRLADGTAVFLVQSWYRPILMAAALALIFLSLMALARELGALPGRPRRQRARVTLPGAIALVLVAIPLAVGFGFKPEPLGSQSLKEDPASARQFSASAATSDAALRNIYQWAYEFQTRQPSELAGEAIEVTGFVYHKPGEAEDRFQIARFVVACCVADAQGYTLPVQWKDAQTLESDRWVTIKGRIASAPDGTAIIQASEIESIDAPTNPYIYP